MAKPKTIKGKDLMIFIAGAATAAATSHKLSLKADTSDTASKDSGMWDESEVAKMSWDASADALVSFDADSNSYEAMYDAMLAAVPVDIIVGVPANQGNVMPDGGWTAPTGTQIRYTGKALITSVDLTAGNGDNATMSVSLKGVGPLNKLKTTQS